MCVNGRKNVLFPCHWKVLLCGILLMTKK
jgi:hypothetical protein